jgi:hypothetical protein
MTKATREIMAHVLAETLGPDARDTPSQFAEAVAEPIEFVDALIAAGVLALDPDGLLPVWSNLDAIRTYRSPRH